MISKNLFKNKSLTAFFASPFCQAQTQSQTTSYKTNSQNVTYEVLSKEEWATYGQIVDNSQVFDPSLPRKSQNSSYHFSLLKNSEFWSAKGEDQLNQFILNPLWDQLDRKTGPWRKISTIMMAECFGRKFTVPEGPFPDFKKDKHPELIGKDNNQDIFWLISAVELVRNGTLIVDDIEDSSENRRGEPSLYKQYGIDIALNTGNWIYFYPYALLGEYQKQGIFTENQVYRLQKIFLEELTLGHFGQNWDNSFRKDRDYIPTTEEFCQMAVHKCFVRRLLNRCLGVILNLSEEECDVLRRFGQNISLCSQLHNDFINLKSEDYGMSIKGMVGEDILEGKKTLLVSYAYNNSPKERADRLLDLLKQEDNTEEEIREAIHIIATSGAYEFCEDFLTNRLEKMLSEFETITTNKVAFHRLKTLLVQTFQNY